MLRYKLLHITLALAVLLSTTGIAVHQHICQNTVMGTALFFKPKCKKATHATCHAAKHCAKHEEKSDNNCCKDKARYYKLDLDKQLTLTQFKPLKQSFFLALAWPVLLAPEALVFPKILPYLHYRPPLIGGKRQIHLQVFRL